MRFPLRSAIDSAVGRMTIHITRLAAGNITMTYFGQSAGRNALILEKYFKIGWNLPQ